MKKTKLLLVIVFAFILSSCATAYKQQGFKGGYSETKIQNGLYKVSFKGNGYVSEEKAADYALLRAAEITINDGCKYFIVLSENTKSDGYQYTTPVTSTTSGNVYTYGDTAQISATTQYSGGHTTTFYQPRSTILIQVLDKKPKPGPFLVFDAIEVRNNIRARHKVGENWFTSKFNFLKSSKNKKETP